MNDILRKYSRKKNCMTTQTTNLVLTPVSKLGAPEEVSTLYSSGSRQVSDVDLMDRFSVAQDSESDTLAFEDLYIEPSEESRPRQWLAPIVMDDDLGVWAQTEDLVADIDEDFVLETLHMSKCRSFATKEPADKHVEAVECLKLESCIHTENEAVRPAVLVAHERVKEIALESMGPIISEISLGPTKARDAVEATQRSGTMGTKRIGRRSSLFRRLLKWFGDRK